MYNPEFTNVLRAYADRYYSLGFNITMVCENGKWPAHRWKAFQTRRQLEYEAFRHPWYYATGIGAVTGINSYYCLDFDKCSINLIPYYHGIFRLPKDYNWTVISGSGEGFHIWFTSANLANAITDAKVVVIKPGPSDFFKQAELRLNAHTILPPSKHRSGSYYKFYKENNLLTKPNSISYEHIIRFIGQSKPQTSV
jgi:hypothetical protein